MKKDSLKNEKGITLIALIITIIILVILAAISLRAAFETGIIDFSVKGAENYVKKAEEENKIISETESFIESIINDSGDGITLLAALKNGTITVGDYINYQAPAVNETIEDSVSGAMEDPSTPYGGQTFSVTQAQSSAIGWRVLGYGNSRGELTLNENEATNVLLIAARPEPTYLVLGKEQAYLNGPTILNNLSSKFATSGKNAATEFTTSQTTARSIKKEDLNTAFGITINGTTMYKNGTELASNTYRVASGNYTYDEYDWVLSENSLSFGTGVGNTVTLDAYSYTVLAGDETDIIGHMLLDGAATTEIPPIGAESYWLASRGVGELGCAIFGPDAVYGGNVGSSLIFFDSHGAWFAYRYGVRPIVSIGSGIKYGTGTGQLTKIDAPTTSIVTEAAGTVTYGSYYH